MKQIHRWSSHLLAAALALFVFTSVSEVQAAGKPKLPKPIYTAVASVDTAAMTITTETKNTTTAATKTYKLTAKTTVTINGQPGTLAGLTPGLRISVGLGMDAGTAESLSATTPPPDPNDKSKKTGGSH